MLIFTDVLISLLSKCKTLMLLIYKCIVLITNLRRWLICVAHYKRLKLTALREFVWTGGNCENTRPRVDCILKENSLCHLFNLIVREMCEFTCCFTLLFFFLLRDSHFMGNLRYAPCRFFSLCKLYLHKQKQMLAKIPLCVCISRSSPSFAFLTLLSWPWLAINSS